MNFINQKELEVTNSMIRQNEIRKILSGNTIDYKYHKTKANYAVAYRFFVHKRDYERAIRLIRNSELING